MASYKIEDIKLKGLEGLRSNPDLRAFFFKTYSSIFGTACATCSGKLAAYYLNYLNHLQMSENTKTPKFVYKDKLTAVDGLGFVNKKNMTDEKAVKMLAISSGFLKNFETYPENWDALVRTERDKQAKAKAPVAPKAEKVETPKAEEKVEEVKTEETPVAKKDESPAPQDPGPTEEYENYFNKLVAMNGIAKATAEKIISDFPNEAALEAHIAAGKDLEYSPQANKALLASYGG